MRRRRKLSFKSAIEIFLLTYLLTCCCRLRRLLTLKRRSFSSTSTRLILDVETGCVTSTVLDTSKNKTSSANKMASTYFSKPSRSVTPFSVTIYLLWPFVTFRGRLLIPQCHLSVLSSCSLNGLNIPCVVNRLAFLWHIGSTQPNESVVKTQRIARESLRNLWAQLWKFRKQNLSTYCAFEKILSNVLTLKKYRWAKLWNFFAKSCKQEAHHQVGLGETRVA